MRPSGGGGGRGRRAVRHAVVVLRRELSSDLEPVVRANQTIDRCSMDMVEALVPLKAAMGKAVGEEEEEEEGEDALPALQALCTQMADGWCTQLLEVMTTNMQQAFKLESWQPLYEGTTHSSSVVDLFTQLDQLTQVSVMSFAPLAPPLQVAEEFIHRLSLSSGAAPQCWPRRKRPSARSAGASP